MASVAHGWDGVWGSLIGGLLGAATVVIGVLLAQRLSDARRQRDERRAAADALLLEVANARDAAVHSRSKARSGRYDLWPLRHRIYLSHSLRALPIMQAIENYYDAVWQLRNWVRHGPIAQDDRAPGERQDEQAFAQYQRAVDVWADHLIEALRDLEPPLSGLVMNGPAPPELPD